MLTCNMRYKSPYTQLRQHMRKAHKRANPEPYKPAKRRKRRSGPRLQGSPYGFMLIDGYSITDKSVAMAVRAILGM